MSYQRYQITAVESSTGRRDDVAWWKEMELSFEGIWGKESTEQGRELEAEWRTCYSSVGTWDRALHIMRTATFSRFHNIAKIDY